MIITDTYVGVPGGSERHLLNFLSNISLDFDVTVIQMNPEGNPIYPDGLLLERENVRLVSIPLQKLNSLSSLKKVYEIYQIVREFKPMVIASYHEKSDLLNFALSKLPRCNHKTVSSKRDMGLKLTGRLGKLISQINPNFDAITAPSKSIIDQVIECFNGKLNKSYVVANGVDLEKYGKATDPIIIEERKRHLGIPENKNVIISIGWLREGKGHEYLIRALSLFDVDDQWIVVILGEGPDRARLEKIVSELNLENKVHLVGLQNNVSEWLSVSDLAVSASLSEGLSNALVEASASYLPIIATNVGGNPEVVEHNQNGLLIEPASTESIVNALNQITSCRNLISDMGALSRKTAETKFSIQAMVESLEALYSSLAGDYRG